MSDHGDNAANCKNEQCILARMQLARIEGMLDGAGVVKWYGSPECASKFPASDRVFVLIDQLKRAKEEPKHGPVPPA